MNFSHVTWPNTTEIEIQAAFAPNQGMKQSVKRAKAETLEHILSKIKRGFPIRTQFEIIEFKFEYSVNFL